MFFCFHRKNYNKAPLFWLSNILYWKTNGSKDVYNFFCSYLSVIDEYFVEFVHSMARKSTNQSDNVEQLRQKMFSLFVSGERQANFRAAFRDRPLENLWGGGAKNIHTRNLITKKKIPAARKFPTPAITFLMVRPLPLPRIMFLVAAN